MATLVRRFDPFRELASLQSDMRRMIYAEGVGERDPRAWIPALDIWENENEVVYAFDLPGIPEEKIAVELEDGALSVSAEGSARKPRRKTVSIATSATSAASSGRSRCPQA